jgi:hypothetical protein
LFLAFVADGFDIKLSETDSLPPGIKVHADGSGNKLLRVRLASVDGCEMTDDPDSQDPRKSAAGKAARLGLTELKKVLRFGGYETLEPAVLHLVVVRIPGSYNRALCHAFVHTVSHTRILVSVCMYVCLSVCWCVCLYVCLYICLSVCMSFCLSVYVYIYVSVCLL